MQQLVINRNRRKEKENVKECWQEAVGIDIYKMVCSGSSYWFKFLIIRTVAPGSFLTIFILPFPNALAFERRRVMKKRQHNILPER